MSTRLPRLGIRDQVHLDWISVFGIGMMRPASGTWGSMPPVIVAWLLFAAGVTPDRAPLVYYGVIGAMLVWACAGCIAQGDHAEARWGKDPSNAVADEVAGQCIPLLALPIAADADWKRVSVTLLAAFLLFRIMDIVKPPPARGIQKAPAGWGILLDDLIAGVYAAIALFIVSRWF